MQRISVALALAICACGNPPHTEPVAPPPGPPPASVASEPPGAPAPPVAKKDGPPLAAVRPVKDTYHGVTVEDPYRWLEDDTPEVKAWSDAQNGYARAILAKLPEQPALVAELDKILKAPVTTYSGFKVGGTKLFARRHEPTDEQPKLIEMTDPDHAKTAKVVFDPISADHPHRSFDWFVPSPDGSKIAIAESDGGSEVADVHIVDASGKELEVVPNVQRPTGGGDVAWTPDGKGLYYTRYPMPGEPHEADKDAWLQVYFHRLGEPTAKDAFELGKDLPKNAEILLASDSRGRVIASVQQGDGGIFRHYLKDKTGWRQLDDWNDRIVTVAFGATPELWLISRKDAPRGKLMKLAATAKTAQEAVVVVPEGKDAMITSFEGGDEGVTAVGDHVFVRYQLGGPSELRSFYATGKPDKGPIGPPVSAASKPVAWRGDVLLAFSSYVTPTTWVRFSPKSGKTVDLPDFTPKYPVDFSTIEARREVATSKDGTAVPLNILWPKGAPKDGSVACVVTGYGGFSISEEPNEMLGYAPLLSRGMCIVVANLRGGGEYGEDWHRNGMMLKKQNVFDDFAAALEYLVAKKYTSRHELGIIGGSNGGLLMGAMITQHPDAMKAVVASVGIYDMLRNELTPNGAYNTSEYGSVSDADQFKALYAYSPYHHVRAGAFPAILMHTGANDGRVAPWQSRKMLAALQAANRGDTPILLHTSETAGHGMGTNMSEKIETLATELAFLRWQLQ